MKNAKTAVTAVKQFGENLKQYRSQYKDAFDKARKRLAEQESDEARIVESITQIAPLIAKAIKGKVAYDRHLIQVSTHTTRGLLKRYTQIEMLPRSCKGWTLMHEKTLYDLGRNSYESIRGIMLTAKGELVGYQKGNAQPNFTADSGTVKLDRNQTKDHYIPQKELLNADYIEGLEKPSLEKIREHFLQFVAFLPAGIVPADIF